MHSHSETAYAVFEIQIEGLREVKAKLNDAFGQAVDLVCSSTGRVIVCGMGKSGIIGRKIAATLASTGCPAYFLHPAEGFHGDLGVVGSDDVFMAISNSGETEELVRLLPFLNRRGNLIIAITGDPSSTLALNAAVNLDAGVAKEACPLQLAPTASTTAVLVMGDALAIAIMERRGFRAENFAEFHPGGALGRRLFRSISDEMICEDLPLVSRETTLFEVLRVMTSTGHGFAYVCDDRGMGVLTDGDLRRALNAHGNQSLDMKMHEIMNEQPMSERADAMLIDVLTQMTDRKIHCILVTNDADQVIGLLKRSSLPAY